jgi:molybdate transport system ATP-binding protein
MAAPDRPGHHLQAAVEQRFAGGFALDLALDVVVGAGAILVVFGPSGAGKTSLLRQIAGLDRPSRGRIAFDDEVWCDTSAGIWCPPQQRRVGVVFQEPTLFPHLTVRDNVRYGLQTATGSTSSGSRLDRHPMSIRGRPVRDPTMTRPRPDADPVADIARLAADPVADIARLAGVDLLEHRYPRALSGGEAHRVALARALAVRPRLLLLDEPFASLDGPTRVRLRRDVRALLHATGTPAILVTHDRNEAIAMGDLIAVVVAGRLRQLGAIADVFSHPGDAAVAASLGVEAVLPARVADVSAGIVEVEINGVVLHVAERDPVLPGTDVFACIRAEDVMLEKHVPGDASARNHLAARVVHITSEGPIDRVALDCGFPLDALITRRSREEMHLAPGVRVTAAVKATSVHLVPRA